MNGSIPVSALTANWWLSAERGICESVCGKCKRGRNDYSDFPVSPTALPSARTDGGSRFPAILMMIPGARHWLVVADTVTGSTVWSRLVGLMSPAVAFSADGLRVSSSGLLYNAATGADAGKLQLEHSMFRCSPDSARTVGRLPLAPCPRGGQDILSWLRSSMPRRAQLLRPFQANCLMEAG